MTNVTMDLVDAIGEAFNANNIDDVMKFFSQDDQTDNELCVAEVRLFGT